MKLYKMLTCCFMLVVIVLVSCFLLPLKAEAAVSGYYTYSVSGGEATITDCSTMISGNITIPSTLGGYPVTAIGYEAFYNCNNLTGLTISNGVKSIDNSAFCNCDSLTSVTIGDSVISIGNSVFSDCDRLTGVIIGDSVADIGSNVFSGCSSLTSVKIGSSVESVGYAAFYNCTSLVNVNIPESVTYIGSAAFRECTSLTSVTIPDSVSSIGNYTFYNCASLTSVTIPNSVTSIGDRAFYNCTSLTSVAIGDGVTSIGDYAFYECINLTSVTIPDGVKSVGDYTFYGCESLTSVNIGDGVTSIGASAFHSCFGLTGATIPNSVTNIGTSAFCYCTGLESITVGDGLTYIGDAAFRWCSRLTNIYYGGTKNQWSTINIGTYNTQLSYATLHYQHIHDYTLIPFVTVDPTCTQNGYIEYTCAFGETYRQTLLALDHDYSVTVTVVNPTCMEDGYTTYQCFRCDETKDADPISSLGHDYSGTVTVVDSTCMVEGYTETQCIRCDSVKKTNYTDTIAHKMVLVPAVPATCTQTGLTVGTACQWCGLVGVAQTEIAALGGNCDYSVDPTTCGNCGYIRADVAINHVVLRTSCSGLYFKGGFVFGVHETVTRYGIAVSLYNKLPMADDTDETSLYTIGENSVLISNILGNGKDGKTLIYARPYVLLDDGTYIYGDVVATNLKTVVEAIDAKMDGFAAVQKEALSAMYLENSAVMQDWLIPEIKKYV